jgi:hypothetical protein
MLEEFELVVVLRLIGTKMGTTDFAEFVGEKVQNIDKFIKGKRNPKIEMLNKYLLPFGLKAELTIMPIGRDKAVSI